MLELNQPDLFRTVLESLQTGVYLVDRGRRILFWNDGAQRITGYLPQDVVGRFLREHLLVATGRETDGVDAEPADPVDIVFRDGKISITEVSILHKEGYRVPILLRTVPIRDSHGTVIVAVESFDENVSPGRRRRNAAIAELGQLDRVACAPNQAFMEARLVERLANVAEHNAHFAILLIEVDRMDHFLKTLGQGVVPTILRVVAHAIENSLRPDDLVGRWSGNRFLAILEGCKESEVEKVGDRIRKMIGNSEIEWWGDSISIAAALGGAGARPEDTVELLIDRAQRSLLESIAAGGNRVTVLA